MSTTQFFIQLAVVTLIAVALVIGCNLQVQMAAAKVLSWSTILVFVVFSFIVYFLSSLSARQSNKHSYTSIILGAMMTKMFMCIIVVAIYVKMYEPASNYFLIPFFAIYILYTIFEVHFMTRIGKYDGI